MSLKVHRCYTVVTLLLNCCHTVVTLLSHCCHTVVTLLSHCCYTVGTLLSHCCHTVVTLFLPRYYNFLHCCHTGFSSLLHFCYTVVTMLSLMRSKMQRDLICFTFLEHFFNCFLFPLHISWTYIVLNVLCGAHALCCCINAHSPQECIRARTLASRPGQGADVHVP
jgi:hypothetical protein